MAVFTVAVVSGQIGSSLLMDQFGVGPGGLRPVSGQRLVGALLAMCAVGLAMSDRLAHPAELALAVGMACIGSMVVLVRRIGVLLLGLDLVAGQLVASVLLDLLVASGRYPLTVITLMGTALTLVAAAIAAWPRREQPSPAVPTGRVGRP